MTHLRTTFVVKVVDKAFKESIKKEAMKEWRESQRESNASFSKRNYKHTILN